MTTRGLRWAKTRPRAGSGIQRNLSWESSRFWGFNSAIARPRRRGSRDGEGRDAGQPRVLEARTRWLGERHPPPVQVPARDVAAPMTDSLWGKRSGSSTIYRLRQVLQPIADVVQLGLSFQGGRVHAARVCPQQ